jgi:hypothetical protein
MFGDVDRLAGGVLERLLEAFPLEFVCSIASLAVKLPPYSSSVSQVAMSRRQGMALCDHNTPFEKKKAYRSVSRRCKM